MIPIIQKETVENHKFIKESDILDIVAIAESTPGPIAINCATFVGYARAGFPGAVAATVGIVVPSFVIIYAISMFLDNFLEITLIANAFRGIKLAVGLLILNAGLNMLQKMKKTPLSLGILIAGCAIMTAVNLLSLRFSSITLMVLAGLVCLCLFALEQKGGKQP